VNDRPQPLSTRADRPQTIVILATSVDGKIADRDRSPARFGSAQDKAHLESQIAQVDAVLFGAGTLRSYGTSLPITNPDLLQHRHQQDQPPQPIHIVVSASGVIDPDLRFFQQPLPRWLLTTSAGDRRRQEMRSGQFDRGVVADDASGDLDWSVALAECKTAGIETLAILGGGTVVAALLEAGLIDQLWVTICPLLLGGSAAPTLVEGAGFLQAIAPRLRLLEVKPIDQEVFLHYQVLPTDPGE
jgi:5-amino-6-(5-phosphoribosylamino)uracil reductase